jgi:hypothetical protein
LTIGFRLIIYYIGSFFSRIDSETQEPLLGNKYGAPLRRSEIPLSLILLGKCALKFGVFGGEKSLKMDAFWRFLALFLGSNWESFFFFEKE